MTILPSSPETVARIASGLRAGGLAAIPTETVYGLAADATNPRAVAVLYALKGRPAFNPLIAHVPGLAEAQACGVLDERAQSLAQAFWPGPLTLVVPRAPGGPVCDLACAGLATVALRAPAHPLAQAVIAAVGRPLAAPSANRSGRISPTTAQAVAEELGQGVDILDGGPCAAGVESTIVALLPSEPARLLRPGALARADIEAQIGPLAAPGEGVHAPGMLASHYAPDTPIRLNATAAEPNEELLGFGEVCEPAGLNLSPSGDLTEAAANLYAMLRTLDARRPQAIAVAPIPHDGLGEAINDRLARAAAPR